jgi:spermidine/putrescine transport system substrate-binding protein
MIPVMVRDGMLEKIDAKTMPNFGNIAPNFLGLAFDPERAYTVPVHVGHHGLHLRLQARARRKLEESWKAFFEPPAALAGQIAALNDEVEMWNAAAYYLGIDKCTASPEDGRRILAVLEAQKPASPPTTPTARSSG